jgi:hypothetical protein
VGGLVAFEGGKLRSRRHNTTRSPEGGRKRSVGEGEGEEGRDQFFECDGLEAIIIEQSEESAFPLLCRNTLRFNDQNN